MATSTRKTQALIERAWASLMVFKRLSPVALPWMRRVHMIRPTMTSIAVPRKRNNSSINRGSFYSMKSFSVRNFARPPPSGKNCPKEKPLNIRSSTDKKHKATDIPSINKTGRVRAQNVHNFHQSARMSVVFLVLSNVDEVRVRRIFFAHYRSGSAECSSGTP